MTLKPNTTASEAAPTITVARSASPRVRNHDPSSRSGFVPETSVPVSFGQLADHDVDRRAEQEARDHGPRQELRDPPHPEQREHEVQRARDEGDERDEGRRRPRSL